LVTALRQDRKNETGDDYHRYQAISDGVRDILASERWAEDALPRWCKLRGWLWRRACSAQNWSRTGRKQR
jgi:hypothetical protein